MSLKALHGILGFSSEAGFSCSRVCLIGLLAGVNAGRELDRPAHSAWMALKQILEINCDSQNGGTPPRVMICPHNLDLTALAFPLGSFPNVLPAKSSSAHTLKLNVLLFLAMIPLSAVPAMTNDALDCSCV